MTLSSALLARHKWEGSVLFLKEGNLCCGSSCLADAVSSGSRVGKLPGEQKGDGLGMGQEVTQGDTSLCRTPCLQHFLPSLGTVFPLTD